MTVSELIAKLQALPQNAQVTVYEAEPDAYIDVQSIELMEAGLEVRIYSGLEP